MLPLKFPSSYDLEYEYETPKGLISIRMSSDGKGKTLEDTSGGNLRTIKVIDYAEKSIRTAYVLGKIIHKTGLKESYEEPTEDVLDRKATKYLGEQSLLGFACKGWLFEGSNSISEMWIASTERFIVLHKSVFENQKYVMTLLKHNSVEPSSDLFVLPSGYEELEIP